jgi:hypothetical protein
MSTEVRKRIPLWSKLCSDVATNPLIVSGVSEISSSVSAMSQAKHTHLANYGASVRPQSRQGGSLKPKVQAVVKAMGCRRGGTFVFAPEFQRRSVVAPVRELYSRFFAGQFLTSKAAGRSCTLPTSVPLLSEDIQKASLSSRFELNGSCPTYGLLLSSFPFTSESHFIHAACFENEVRSNSEGLLHDVFSSIPYATCGFVSAENLQSAVDYSVSVDKAVPFLDLCRPLPKASLGLYPRVMPITPLNMICLLVKLWAHATLNFFENSLVVSLYIDIR